MNAMTRGLLLGHSISGISAHQGQRGSRSRAEMEPTVPLEGAEEVMELKVEARTQDEDAGAGSHRNEKEEGKGG